MEIRLTDEPPPHARDALLHRLVAFNEAAAGPSDARPLALLLGDDVAPEGGLWGRTAYGWLFVELLVVPDRLRGQGVGSELLRRAEAEARARGCRGVWLDTFEFQARGFYERHGYTVFGRLDDYPAGHARFFLRKLF